MMRGVFLVVSAISLLAPVIASPQRPDGREQAEAADQERREQARAHFQNGLTLMEGENWEAAIIEFNRSLALFPTRSALFNLANCLRALFRYVEAVDTFERWLVEYGEEARPEERASVERALAELRALLGEITVRTTVRCAHIELDGAPVGTAPLDRPLRTAVGHHVVSARVDGYAMTSRQVTLGANRIGKRFETWQGAARSWETTSWHTMPTGAPCSWEARGSWIASSSGLRSVAGRGQTGETTTSASGAQGTHCDARGR